MRRRSPFRKLGAAAAVAAALAGVPISSDRVVMAGGMDQVTPPYVRKPGTLRLAQNFEASIFGGYSRIAGYERTDGRPKPSNAQYSILTANITGAPATGQTLVGATSGATGVIIALPGAQFVLTKVVGTFTNGENLNVGGPTIATATATQVPNGASTAQLHAQYRNLAADQYRADIAAVPGSGNVLGCCLYNDVWYAFRNNAGGTAADLYKQTAGGWSKVAFEYEVTYTAGSGAATIIDGGTLTQGGVTATIRRVLTRTGSLASATGVGTLVISVPAGGNFAAGPATVGAGTLTLGGIQTAITLAPSGRFEFVLENFLGGSSTKRMYGVDGVNTAFEFDGSYFVPIHTGMTVDTPKHITAHKKFLWLSFSSSVQFSSVGVPYAWTPVTGAGEIGMGDEVTGFGKMPGSQTSAALPIFTNTRLSILYGSSSADWLLVPYRDEIGAYAYTIQDVGYAMFLHTRGITNIQQSQKFGNFAHAMISNSVRSLIAQYRTLAVASCISRDKSQYRLFFSNKYAFYVTLVGDRVVGIMQVLLAHNVKAMWSGQKADGSEEIFFGDDSGYVYQMEKGTSFDGANIDYYIETAFNFSGSPRVTKQYRDIAIEIEGSGYAEFSFAYTLGYGDTLISQPDQQTVVTSFSAVYWDSFTWDAFYWDGQTLLPSVVGMDGEAENVSIAIRGSSDYFESFTVTGLLMHYTPRRKLRA